MTHNMNVLYNFFVSLLLLYFYPVSKSTETIRHCYPILNSFIISLAFLSNLIALRISISFSNQYILVLPVILNIEFLNAILIVKTYYVLSLSSFIIQYPRVSYERPIRSILKFDLILLKDVMQKDTVSV